MNMTAQEIKNEIAEILDRCDHAKNSSLNGLDTEDSQRINQLEQMLEEIDA